MRRVRNFSVLDGQEDVVFLNAGGLGRFSRRRGGGLFRLVLHDRRRRGLGCRLFDILHRQRRGERGIRHRHGCFGGLVGLLRHACMAGQGQYKRHGSRGQQGAKSRTFHHFSPKAVTRAGGPFICPDQFN